MAVLNNSFSIRHVRREVVGPNTRLWLCEDAGGGYLEIPTEQIVEVEPAPTAVPAPAATGTPETGAGNILPTQDSIQNLIENAALRHQIDPDFVASVVKVESSFSPAVTSAKGAGGLMQLMPRTAAWLGVENVLDPAANVEGGTRYLRQLLDQYHGDVAKALAAYNAGPHRVEQYGGIPPYPETRAYVARVIEDYNRKKLQQQAQSTAAPPDR